ncbi:hypothetical protein BDB00DRAFT_836829 [Zychaea mexicana]|uniref:uncharacterized protein n=1 Tax=Zychaea mexicana TaxID=64656 RepID=UPI0022FECF75|nr:uncharacterized protein BDB00DRAFT_836829 [Zychaea mexicana]KAI9490667.1 hypothetical protein BDB00DRAFT_836829 [Zychaea mexicana]
MWPCLFLSLSLSPLSMTPTGCRCLMLFLSFGFFYSAPNAIVGREDEASIEATQSNEYSNDPYYSMKASMHLIYGCL